MNRPLARSSLFLFTTAAMFLVVFTSPTFGQGIAATNSSQQLGNGRWEWTVYITAARDVLSQIDCVEYTLHPTFPKPIQTICSIGDDRTPFGLSATGWGEFQIRIRVFKKDKRIVELTHDLKLGHGR